ncbi:hypothetical protein LTR56_001166 [Elasticomyces elasticus]|nr:hypothetical protein LTR22_016202 [Elasticomyces elasticus]KAK3659802.1 hypothetical protein LTR56_001166 [Elasticomyces elasticus]KAK4914322.1 hypothetical protein LTR49_017460 [Elasticomyces elasticus]KAK5769087.1 hypothetical protein LTS12_000801 [Elasticomyces elasticus]
MSNDTTSMLAYPGPNWRMHWLDGGLGNLQLDVVGFLAILGEDAVKRTSRLASLSKLFWLPRLLPAPHSLLYVERPERLDTVKAQVNSIHSGNHRDYLSHTAAALFDFEMPVYGVRCLSIRSRAEGLESANMTTKWTAPVILVNLFGCGLSVVLFVASLAYGDGMSLIATVLLSLLSTLVGLTNAWTLPLPRRRMGSAPDATVVIRWPNGSFLVVKADEDLSRTLFFRPDTLNYMIRPSTLIPLSMPGTVILMVSVIALANAKIELQIGWAGAYILLNVGHWVAAALPRRMNWDTSAFEIDEEFLSSGSQAKGYIETFWQAIVFTKSTAWLRKSDAVPMTPVWEQWLAQAEEHVQNREKTTKPRRTDLGPGIIRRATTWRKEQEAGTIPPVWSVPNEWDPRAAWDKLNREHNNA